MSTPNTELETAAFKLLETWDEQRGRVRESMGDENPRCEAIWDAFEALRAVIIKHGENCPKAAHIDGRDGYLHGADDDRPYDVDGSSYCGRCHYAL